MKTVTITGKVTLAIRQVLEVPDDEVEHLLENLDCNYDLNLCSWDIESEEDFEAEIKD